MEQHRVWLGFPGKALLVETMLPLVSASQRHRVRHEFAVSDHNNFDALWASALNAFEQGLCSHFAMLHSDLNPGLYWLDPLLETMDRRKVGLVSATVAIKDERRLLSCGIGDPDNSWMPLRRLTSKELIQLPADFDAAALGHPGKPLLHNDGCWVADLRFAQWRQTDEAGNLLAHFAFPRRVRRDAAGQWQSEEEGEDFYFSRRVHELGIPSAICRMTTVHRGEADYLSDAVTADGWECDEGTRARWEQVNAAEVRQQ